MSTTSLRDRVLAKREAAAQTLGEAESARLQALADMATEEPLEDNEDVSTTTQAFLEVVPDQQEFIVDESPEEAQALSNTEHLLAQVRNATSAIVQQSQSRQLPMTSTGRQITPLDATGRNKPGDRKEFDILVVMGQRRWGAADVVYAVLDRMNPDVVVTGDGAGVQTLARTWAISRGKEVIMMVADWEGQGVAAGPLRNGQMMDYVAEAKIQHGKTGAVLLFIDEDRYGFSSATRSMHRIADERNSFFESQPQLRPYKVPVIHGKPWLDEDFLAANPKGKLGEVDLPLGRDRDLIADSATGTVTIIGSEGEIM